MTSNSNPNFRTGQIPTAVQWNADFGEKIDATNGTSNNQIINNPTINGTVGGTPTFPSLAANSATITGALTAGSTTVTGSATATRNVITGTAQGSNSLAITQSQTLSNSSAGNVVNAHGSFFGSRSDGLQLNWYSLNIDTDRVASTVGATGLYVGHSFGGGAPATLTGGRTALFAGLTMAGDNSTGSGSGSFYVAEGAFARCDYWNGGSPGDERGSVFGSNPSARLKSAGSIGSRQYRGCNGMEINVGVDHMIGGKQGCSVIEWTDSNADGWSASYGYGLCVQGNGTAPGFDFGYSVGATVGWWPLRSTSTIFGNYATVLASGGPTAQAAVGIDWTGIQINKFGYKQTGAAIDGSGNVGGLTTFGTTLQTRGNLQAKTAVVNTITIVKGGEFQSIPTLAVSAPPVSGATATATVAAMSLRRAISIVGNRGTGYAVNDVLTLSGGTGSAAQVTVSAVDSNGAIIDFDYTTPGSYSALPSNPITLTGGTGTGAKITTGGWQIATVTVSGAGTNYPEFPPPLVTTSGGTKLAEPMFDVSMTASAATMTLNNTTSVSATGLLSTQPTIALSNGSGALFTFGDSVTANSNPLMYSYLVGGSSGCNTVLGFNAFYNTSGTFGRINTAKNAWYFAHDTRSSNDPALLLGVVGSSGSGITALTISNVGDITPNGVYKVGSNQVVGARITGWGTATNGSKSSFDGSTATLAQTSAAVAQLISDLRTHGLIGT